ncbi:MAG: hypothetical protein FD152_391 [Xanthobacteraceae bacterium]|nr:MAG: hypothetical protein FD152_391 [Xanthobacteraceae bacterium]
MTSQTSVPITGLDTNVLVRFLVQDDVAQAKAAQDLMATFTEVAPGFICRCGVWFPISIEAIS